MGEQNKKIVNDFCITFSTINGSGSATANTTLMRALFRMGIPVSGKNIFPSNIQGQPTWFSLRVNKDGYMARVDKDDIVVSMNPQTVDKEIEFINSEGVLLIPDDFKIPEIRPDVHVYQMPVKKLVKDSNVAPALRDYIANMVYVGVVAQLLALMDGLSSRGEVIVVAATNRPNALDPAIRRGGRFDREIEIGIPSKNGRLEVLYVHTRGMPLDESLDLKEIADATHGFVGADLYALCKEAAMRTLERALPDIDVKEDIPAEIVESLRVTKEDFQEALKKTVLDTMNLAIV